MDQHKKKFTELGKLKYKDQAIWFMNGFWGDGVNGEVANTIWNYIQKFVELDNMGTVKRGDAGNELDQFWSAKFLEDMDTALPALQRKEALRTIDTDSNGKMSALEYLVWKYKKGVQETAEAPQGDNTGAIKKAQEAVNAVSAQLTDCETKLEKQKKAKEENDAAVSQLEAAEQENEAAVAELKRQEEDYQNKISTLEAKSKDANASTVQKNKAANELAQLKGEDPLPLRKAKITQEASLRKVQKQKNVALEAGIKLQQAIRELEEAYVQLDNKLQEAVAELEKIKNKPGGGKGALWWLQRELFEMDNRLPRSKQKFDHSKPFSYNP